MKAGRERRNPRRWLEPQWKKAVRFAAEHPPVADRADVLAEVNRIRQAVEQADWPGVAGTTDRLVLEAHLGIIERSGKIQHRAGVREVAELVGRQAKTVTQSHKRLRQTGWLRLIGPYRQGATEAMVWKVQVPERWCKTTTVVTSDTGVQETVPFLHQDQAHDAFRHGGLGLGGGLAYTHLDPVQPVTIKILVQRLGQDRSTWSRRLARLQEHGLAIQTPSGWLRGVADLEQVARNLGTAGAGARQQQQHRDDRDAFKKWLDEGQPCKHLVSVAYTAQAEVTSDTQRVEPACIRSSKAATAAGTSDRGRATVGRPGGGDGPPEIP